MHLTTTVKEDPMRKLGVRRKLRLQMVAGRLGRAMLRATQPPLNLWRGRFSPDLPLAGASKKAEYRDRKFLLPCRCDSPSHRLAVGECFLDGRYDLPGGVRGLFIGRLCEEIVASGLIPLIVRYGADIRDRSHSSLGNLLSLTPIGRYDVLERAQLNPIELIPQRNGIFSGFARPFAIRKTAAGHIWLTLK